MTQEIAQFTQEIKEKLFAKGWNGAHIQAISDMIAHKLTKENWRREK